MAGPRPVYIELAHGTYFVKYADRGYRGRYCAAQFYAKGCTLRYVEGWVARFPEKFYLVAKPEAVA